MTIDRLPDDTRSALEVLHSKVNEHDQQIREIQDVNEEQNISLDRIDRTLSKVEKNTSGIVDVVHFVHKLCHVVKLFGKVIIWVSGVAGALASLWYILHNGGVL